MTIDRASRWVCVEIWGDKTANNAAEFRQRRVDQAPFKVQPVLTENGQEFTDRGGAAGERDPTGRHRGDRICAHHGIEHRLIKPRHPQTNGRVERCNGRISEVLATTHFDAAQRLEDTLKPLGTAVSSSNTAARVRTPLARAGAEGLARETPRIVQEESIQSHGA